MYPFDVRSSFCRPITDTFCAQGNHVTTCVDYRIKVFESFGKRCSDLCLDNELPTRVWSLTHGFYFTQGKNICKVIALGCYQCLSLRFLLVTANWSPAEQKELHRSVVNCAGTQYIDLPVRAIE